MPKHKYKRTPSLMSKRPNRRLNIPSIKTTMSKNKRTTNLAKASLSPNFVIARRKTRLRPPLVRQCVLSMSKPFWDQVFFSLKCNKVVFFPRNRRKRGFIDNVSTTYRQNRPSSLVRQKPDQAAVRRGMARARGCWCHAVLSWARGRASERSCAERPCLIHLIEVHSSNSIASLI